MAELYFGGSFFERVTTYYGAVKLASTCKTSPAFRSHG